MDHLRTIDWVTPAIAHLVACMVSGEDTLHSGDRADIQNVADFSGSSPGGHISSVEKAVQVGIETARSLVHPSRDGELVLSRCIVDQNIYGPNRSTVLAPLIPRLFRRHIPHDADRLAPLALISFSTFSTKSLLRPQMATRAPPGKRKGNHAANTAVPRYKRTLCSKLHPASSLVLLLIGAT